MNINVGIRQIEAMQMQLNKGVDATKFAAKVDEVLKDGKITKKEFQALAKDVSGGEATLMKAIEKINPQFDKKYLESTPLPTDRTVGTQIKKDDLAAILKEVKSGSPIKMSENKKEIKGLKDEINMLKAEVDEDNLAPQSGGGKLLGAIEVIHGSAIELSKGGLEGKDKLAQQTKDVLNLAKGDLPKAEDYNLGDAMEISKSSLSMASCVATFASTLLAIKDSVADGANIGDLKSVRNALQNELKSTSPAPTTEKKAELKAKIGALDESIKIIKTSRGANVTDAIGHAINTAGGLMEFSKSVAPHLADSVGMVGNVMSAFSGVVTGVASTIKDSLRVHENRKIKERATEFAANPAKAMLNEKVKEAKLLSKDVDGIKLEGRTLTKDLAGLEKKLETAKASPTRDAREIAGLELSIRDIKPKILANVAKLEDHLDKIDTFTRKPTMNTEYKAELNEKLGSLKHEKSSSENTIRGFKSDIGRYEQEKKSAETQKSGLDSHLVTLKQEESTLNTKHAAFRSQKLTLTTKLLEANALPDTDIGKSTKISSLNTQMSDLESKTKDSTTAINAKSREVSGVEASIALVTSKIDSLTTNLTSVTTKVKNLEARVTVLNTEIGDTDKKITDVTAKIASTLTRDPAIEKLAKIATDYPNKNPAEKKALRQEIGVSTSLDDIGSQVIKRRSVGHSAIGVTKGVLATAGGIAATVGAIAGTVALAATPVGWALGGAAAVVGIGLLVYKVTKTVQRNKTEANLQNQSKELGTMKTGLEAKLGTTTDAGEKTKIEGKIAKITDLKTRVDTMLLKKSPKAAQENIYAVLSNPSTDPKAIEEKSSMKKFVQHVFKVDPDALVSTDAKVQKGMKKILERKMPMFA